MKLYVCTVTWVYLKSLFVAINVFIPLCLSLIARYYHYERERERERRPRESLTCECSVVG